MIYNKLSGFSDEISDDTDEQFTALKRLNIVHFEARGIDGKNISELNNDEVLSLRAKMDKYGIKASSIGSPIGKVKITDDFKTHFSLFERVIKTAKLLGAKYIRIFSFYKDGEWTEEKSEEVFLRLSEMIECAKVNNITLLCENEKDIYGDTCKRCKELMERLYCDNFKMVFDPANFVQCGENTKKAADELYEYIEYMHIKDATFDGTVVPAGDGNGNIEYILKKLFDGGYNGFISLEPHLGSFEGLQALELDDKMMRLEKSGENKFKIAFKALEEILKRL